MVDTWFFLSIFVGILIGIATIINTFLINDNLSPVIMIIYKFTIAFIATMLFLCYLINSKQLKMKDLYELKPLHIMLMILGGLITVVLIFNSLKALKNVPNGGYSVGIKGSVAILVSFILSIMLLKKNGNGHFNMLSFIGLLMVLVGGYLIKVNSKLQ